VQAQTSLKPTHQQREMSRNSNKWKLVYQAIHPAASAQHRPERLLSVSHPKSPHVRALLPFSLSPARSPLYIKALLTHHTDSHAANPTLSWEKDISWLKKECGSEMQVWVKGIATAEDALLAVHHGCDGIVVSNHGGRQLNGALATLDALPEVVQAVQGQIPVHVDGGVRHGTDVFKALALGADFVWIGRPVLWGLAYDGQKGVEHCLRLLADEIRLCFALAGVQNVKQITKDYLVRIDRAGFVSRL